MIYEVVIMDENDEWNIHHCEGYPSEKTLKTMLILELAYIDEDNKITDLTFSQDSDGLPTLEVLGTDEWKHPFTYIYKIDEISSFSLVGDPEKYLTHEDSRIRKAIKKCFTK